MVSGVSAFSRPAGGPVTHGPAAQQGVASLHSFISTLQYYSNERPQQRCDEVQDELSVRRACSPRTNEPWGVDNEAVCGSSSLQPHFFFFPEEDISLRRCSRFSVLQWRRMLLVMMLSGFHTLVSNGQYRVLSVLLQPGSDWDICTDETRSVTRVSSDCFSSLLTRFSLNDLHLNIYVLCMLSCSG